MLKKSLQSRENEMEADSYGLQHFFKQTNYSYEAVAGMFDLLQYGYLPFDEIPFKRSFVETKIIISLMIIILPISNPIKSREDYVDTFDTHPNLKKGVKMPPKSYLDFQTKGAQNFICENLEFDKIRDMARKEAIYINLTNRMIMARLSIMVMYCSVKILMIRMSMSLRLLPCMVLKSIRKSRR